MKTLNTPLITVGIVVLNRAWIIGKVLNSLLNQSYTHSRIFVVLVDGESRDRTVEIARKILEDSDFSGFEIISRKCSIPEGRNICIEHMLGDMLFFLDSDVIIQPDSLERLVETASNTNAEIVSGDGTPVFITSTDEIDEKISEAFSHYIPTKKDNTFIVPFAGMGHTLILKKVFDNVRFDTDLTYSEDMYFSVIAREKGFKIVRNNGIRGLDINIIKKEYSDIYIDMPFERASKGLRKKARAHVLGQGFKISFRMTIFFFLSNKRYIFYLGYIPTIILTIYGLLATNYLFAIFPLYLAFFMLWQIFKRGTRKGLKAVFISLTIGITFSLFLIYYFGKYSLKK